VFDRAAWNRLKYQLDCPLHSQRLMQPTTLHTLSDGPIPYLHAFPAIRSSWNHLNKLK
jgi:hypothetical protein